MFSSLETNLTNHGFYYSKFSDESASISRTIVPLKKTLSALQLCMMTKNSKTEILNLEFKRLIILSTLTI